MEEFIKKGRIHVKDWGYIFVCGFISTYTCLICFAARKISHRIRAIISESDVYSKTEPQFAYHFVAVLSIHLTLLFSTFVRTNTRKETAMMQVLKLKYSI